MIRPPVLMPMSMRRIAALLVSALLGASGCTPSGDEVEIAVQYAASHKYVSVIDAVPESQVLEQGNAQSGSRHHKHTPDCPVANHGIC